MLAIAAEVGFSETAFVTAAAGADLAVRYFSPLAEVPFCGHATIATGVAWARRHGPGALRLATASGEVGLDVRDEDGRPVATLTSVAAARRTAGRRRPRRGARRAGLAPRGARPGAAAARRLGGRLAPRPRRGHPRAAGRPRLRLRRASARSWPPATGRRCSSSGARTPTTFHARDPFPPGGVVEDPATGAAAAALGAYLRELAPRRPAGDADDPPGRRPRPPEPPARRRAARGRHPGQRHRRAAGLARDGRGGRARAGPRRPRRAPAARRGSPGPRRSRAAATRSRWAAFSTPSATTRSPSSWAIVVMAWRIGSLCGSIPSEDDEGAVDLDDVERHVAQRAQRRVARPEVVEVHGDAEGAHGAQLLEQDLVVGLHERRLGDLERQERRRQPGAAQRVLHVPGEAAARELLDGDVDRHAGPASRPRPRRRPRGTPCAGRAGRSGRSGRWPRRRG